MENVHNWRMEGSSFRLLREHPHQMYMDVLEKYAEKNFYTRICADHEINYAVDFIETVAGYKNKRSAVILAGLMNRKPFMPCPADSAQIRNALYSSIWNNQCEAYTALIEAIRPRMEALDKKEKELGPLSFLPVPEEVQVDETTRW